MSTVNAYDISSEAIVSPHLIVKAMESFPEVVLVTFQQQTFELMLRLEGAVQISQIQAGRSIPIYKASFKGREFAFYHSLMGGPASAAILEEVIAKGGKKFLFFGSCVSLAESDDAGSYIIPTAAYRDEGISYHYASPSSYMKIETAERLSQLFDEIKISYVKGRTWTTESFCLEAKNNMLAPMAEGCIAVEMECASIMAVGQFRSVEVYQFLYTQDSLSGESWEPLTRGAAPREMRRRHLLVALEIICRL